MRREGDVSGSEIPGIYFDYLRTGNARGLQPVFYHNSLDIVTLAALSAELARVVSNGWSEGWGTGDGRNDGTSRLACSLDLFSLSRIFDRAGIPDQAASTCRQALAQGLPESLEARALCHLARQHKRQRQYESAAEIWVELARRESDAAIEALEELAMYYEHRRRDAKTALEFATIALERVRATSVSSSPQELCPPSRAAATKDRSAVGRAGRRLPPNRTGGFLHQTLQLVVSMPPSDGTGRRRQRGREGAKS